MTCLPASTDKKLGLVIDLDTCVGCQACVTSCKEWNTGGHMAPLTDIDPYGGHVDGVWFNRVHAYEHTTEAGGRTVHFPRSCLHCETPACVTVCPTGAYKRTPTASCSSTRTSASAASCAAGPAPMARASSTRMSA